MKKRILALALTLAFIFALVPVTAPVVASTDFEWTTYSRSDLTKFSASPETGTFIIEKGDFSEAFFQRQLNIESAGTYRVSVEIKIENFQKPEWGEGYILWVLGTPGSSIRGIGTNLPNNEWTTAVGILTADENESLRLRLNFGDQGKATFRNLKIEKFSSDSPFSFIDDTISASQNPMIPRDYDVLKDREWAEYAKNIDIKDYNLPAALGGTTLTYDSAVALIGKSPEEIAKAVKTVGDVLQYMIAARFGHAPNIPGPDYNTEQRLRVGGSYWGFDPPGNEQLIAGYACCCGGMANTVSYLLNGKYDKVGAIVYSGHIINWVQTGGKYYVFDFIALTGGGSYGSSDYPVTVLDKLEDFYDNFPEWNYINWGDNKSEFEFMVAYESPGVLYPMWWGNVGVVGNENIVLTLPTFAKDKTTIIYAEPGKNIVFRDIVLPSSYNYWELPILTPQFDFSIPLGNITFARNANVTILDMPPANPETRQITATFGAPVYKLDGEAFEAQALTYNGVAYLPAAFLARKLGIHARWDGATNITYLTSTTPVDPASAVAPAAHPAGTRQVTVTIGAPVYMLDGKPLTEQALTYNGVAYLPAAYFARTLGLTARWDAATNITNLTSR